MRNNPNNTRDMERRGQCQRAEENFAGRGMGQRRGARGSNQCQRAGRGFGRGMGLNRQSLSEK